ncbi:MAG: membrane protein insertion efficiency factor YidD [bacterium]
MAVLVTAIRLLIRCYQHTLGVMLPAACRFEPTCSEYALQAVTRHGPVRGSWLILKRLARCHPFGGCGHDPVPERE